MYFPRACILAIYGDQPAATKCVLTSSSCLVCFTQQSDFADPPETGTMKKRTAEKIKKRKRVIRAMSNSGVAGARARAEDRARRIGVNMEVNCPWTNELPHEWVFGPCPKRDNVYQCVPQVNLHCHISLHCSTIPLRREKKCDIHKYECYIMDCCL